MDKKKYFFLILIAILIINFGPKTFNQVAQAYDDFATTTVIINKVCGDGVKAIDEICDKGNQWHTPPLASVFGGLTCNDFQWATGTPYYNTGYLICSDDCSQIFTSMCSYCPNGIKEGLEECDGSDFGGATCSTYGFTEGTLSCTPICRLNLTNCISTNTNLGGSSGGNPGYGGGNTGTNPGFKPGSDTPQQETKIIIKGKAYPSADVHILLDNKIVGIVKADGQANYSFESKEVTPGVASVGFWAEDSKQVKSTTITLTFSIISGAVTTLTGAYLSPTISLDKTKVSKGEKITFYGQTVPNVDIFLSLLSDKEITEKTTSDANGDWKIIYDTGALSDNIQYTAKAFFQMKDGENLIRSGYSRSVSFFLGVESVGKKCAGADLNTDKRVNLTDFSILLYYWGTNNSCADQNSDGKVNLTDFSIMMYYWTG